MTGVRRRLRTLAVLEAFNVAWIGGVALLAGVPVTSASVAGWAATAVLLLQGSAYWWLRLGALDGGTGLRSALPAFDLARRLDPVLLAVLAVPVGVGLVRDPGAASVVGLVLWVLGVLEYVNYFRVQLSHDTRADLRRLVRHGLRRSHLARDLSGWRDDVRSAGGREGRSVGERRG